MNTFVYTINGQLQDDPNFQWMEQNLDSPIVQYRHKLFDQVAKQNTKALSLIIGIGSGGKRSVETWIKSHGGSCSASWNLAKCDASALKKKYKLDNDLMVIGVPHPGGANPNLGGASALARLVKDFSFAGKRVKQKIDSDSKWLPLDKGGDRKSLDSGKNFRYGNAPIPHKDFAFGTNWRMGARGTSSNRRSSHRIQVFSDDGEYNPKESIFTKLPSGNDHKVDASKIGMFKGSDKKHIDGDLPYESPRISGAKADHYDYGPCGRRTHSCKLSQLMMSGWPNFHEMSATVHPSFGYQSIYRGNPKEAKTLVIADALSDGATDFFSTRALSGLRGQKLQSWLNTNKVSDYLILKPFPFDAQDLTDSQRLKIIKSQKYIAHYEKIIAELGGISKFKKIYFVGKASKALTELLGVVKPTEVKLPRSILAIPRNDLPVHTRWWMGTSGDRAQRRIAKNGDFDNNHYVVIAPNWVKYQWKEPRDMPEKEIKLMNANLQKSGLINPAAGRSSSDSVDETIEISMQKDSYVDHNFYDHALDLSLEDFGLAQSSHFPDLSKGDFSERVLKKLKVGDYSGVSDAAVREYERLIQEYYVNSDREIDSLFQKIDGRSSGVIQKIKNAYQGKQVSPKAAQGAYRY